MSKYVRSISEGNFLKGASKDSNTIIKQPLPGIIVLPKEMYKLFNEFELTQSRLWPIKQYQVLVDDFKAFNRELKEWKENNGPQVRNLRMTYYFYENIYTRVKFVNELCVDQEAARKAIVEISQWVKVQKPKVRGEKPKKPEAQMKPSQQDLLEELELKEMSQYNLRKKEMAPYEKMARTTHTKFFPPKQRLLDYHKKEFILNPKLTIDSQELREARLTRTSSMKRTNINGTQFRETATTFQHTKSNFRQTSMTGFNSTTNNFSIKQSVKNQIKQVKQPENEELYKDLQIHEFSLGDPNADPTLKENQQEKAAQQQDELKNMIDEPKYEEDEKDDVEEEQLEEEPQKTKYKKVYEHQHDRQPVASALSIAEQNIKDHQQSTLRRLLKNKEMEIQHKLEDMNIKQKMIGWGKTASFINQQITRKSESYRCINNFPRTEYTKKSFFQKRKEIPQYNLNTQRAKTTERLTVKNVQQACEKKKIEDTLRSFGRYINSHVKINSTAPPTAAQSEEVKLMRATSLTAFNKKDKKKCFGDILAENQFDRYNQEIENEAIHLKQRLSKKLLSVNNKKIFSALSAVKTQREDGAEAFPKVMNLFSNPFFPKHLYETKKKKKK